MKQLFTAHVSIVSCEWIMHRELLLSAASDSLCLVNVVLNLRCLLVDTEEGFGEKAITDKQVAARTRGRRHTGMLDT